MSFPGGLIAGCSAGFMNVARIKGSHTAMKSGIVAAETIFEEISKKDVDSLSGSCLDSFDKNINSSWIIQDLKPSRNFAKGFSNNLWFGLAHGFIVSLTKGREPWTLKGHKHTESTAYEKANASEKIEYPKPDGKITFDLLTNLT